MKMKKELCGHLIVEGLKGQEQKLELYADTVITIGRSHDNDVRLPDDTVSHRHAELRIKLEGAQYQNQGRNGSIVNGSVIYDPAWISLADGAVVVIGKYRLRLELFARDLTRITSKTVIMPLPLEQKGSPDKTMFMPVPGSLSKNAGPSSDAAETMLFTTPSGPVTDYPVDSASRNNGSGGDSARTMFFPAPSRRSNDQSAATAASGSDSPDRKKRASSLPASPPSAAKRQGLSSGFLKTTIGKASVAMVVVILASLALSFTQKNKPAVPPSRVQSKAAEQPAPAAAPPVAVGTVESISEEEFERAKLLFQSAEKLYTERKLNQRNLYDAIQKWRESKIILEKFFQAAEHNTLLVKSLQEKQIKEWKDEAVVNFKKKDFKACYALLQNIMAAVPAIEDSSYRWAKDRESKVLSEMNRTDE